MTRHDEWPEDEDTDVTDVPLRPPAEPAAVIHSKPPDREPVRPRTITRPYELRGRVVLNVQGEP